MMGVAPKKKAGDGGRGRGRQLRLSGTARYLGAEQTVDLIVRFCGTYLVDCKCNDGAADGSRVIVIRATVTGSESRYSIVSDCLDQLRDQHESENGEPPSKPLMQVWEKVLNETWERALL
jgi:hypothetical protein